MYGIPWREVKVTFKTPPSLHVQAHTLSTKHHPQLEAPFSSLAAGRSCWTLTAHPQSHPASAAPGREGGTETLLARGLHVGVKEASWCP